MSAEMDKYRQAKAVMRGHMLDFLADEHGYGDPDFDGEPCDEESLPWSIPSQRAVDAATISVVTLLDLGGGSGLYEVLRAFFRSPGGRAALIEVANRFQARPRASTASI